MTNAVIAWCAKCKEPILAGQAHVKRRWDVLGHAPVESYGLEHRTCPTGAEIERERRTRRKSWEEPSG